MPLIHPTFKLQLTIDKLEAIAATLAQSKQWTATAEVSQLTTACYELLSDLVGGIEDL